MRTTTTYELKTLLACLTATRLWAVDIVTLCPVLGLGILEINHDTHRLVGLGGVWLLLTRGTNVVCDGC